MIQSPEFVDPKAKTVLDVGNCNPDHDKLASFLKRNFDVNVLRAYTSEETLKILRTKPVDLVIVNRKLDEDYSDGTEVIRQIKRDPELAPVPIMLLSNLPEYQTEAVSVGAEYGFGKDQYRDPNTLKILEKYLTV